MRATLLLVAVSLVFAETSVFAETRLPPSANRKIDFEKDIEPILSQKCYSCHGDDAQQSGLRLDKRQNALRGGDYGPVINPGNSAESKLIRRLVDGDGGLQMPPTGPLSDEEIGILRAWIDQGADFRIQVQEDAPAKPVDPKVAAIIAAVRSGDTKAAGGLIAASPELVNAHDRAGNTPLQHAAGFGNLATMKLLLEGGADANAGNKRKSTPLFWSLHDEAKVRLLLDHGANINARTIDGRTPVYQAASMANAVGVLRLLLDKGADPNAQTLVGTTPLMVAARANIEAMRLLIDRKADVNARNGAGGTALMAAAQTGRPQALRLLLEKGADPNVRTKRNESALADAATAGNEETVKLLLDRGAEVNVQDIRGYSPLLYAAGADAMPAGVVKMLLAKGASTAVKGDGETASMLAAKRGDSEVARVLGVPEEERKQLGVAPAPRGSGSESGRSIAAAVGPALALLEKQSHNFIRIGGCNSCHAQDLPSAAAAIAHDHGLPAPKEIPQLPQSMHTLNPERIMDLAVPSVMTVGWEMFDFGNNGIPRDEYTDATVRYIKSMQTSAGNWDAFESRRPPMNTGVYQTTALAVYALKTYGPPAEQADTDQVLARAAAWLEAARPATTQDQAFHLMGLAWSTIKSNVKSNVKPASIAAAAKALAAAQRPDGGWSQLPTMGSDAYASGEALYALSAAGRMPATDPVYEKGVKYLLSTQAADGSWHVKSRSIWVQPYFESGFPYGQDQWISAAGTSWATMALSLTVDPRHSASARETPVASQRTNESASSLALAATTKPK
ncbi:MAG TPA: ankyrin repeat domain-containing protein [Candidatus Acidoferrales bacterium]|nr:ankyrin repeat domain-containing protein [Candidatus Acidoferrales bacterium]